jgi:hypothetical protein
LLHTEVCFSSSTPFALICFLCTYSCFSLI